MSDESEAGEGRAVPSASDTPDDAVVADPTSSSTPHVDLVKSDTASQSDEIADEGPEAAGSERESALVGAAAGSARAAARRSGARAATTPGKGTVTRPRDTGREVRVSAYRRLVRFLREVIGELRKVIWPARNQMVTYTIVVIVFVVFMIAITAGFDVLFAKVVLAIFG